MEGPGVLCGGEGGKGVGEMSHCGEGGGSESLGEIGKDASKQKGVRLCRQRMQWYEGAGNLVALCLGNDIEAEKKGAGAQKLVEGHHETSSDPLSSSTFFITL